MPVILLHSSKTMRKPKGTTKNDTRLPALVARATVLTNYIATLSPTQLEKTMGISRDMAVKVQELITRTKNDSSTLPAIDLFLGDIYSGLQAHSFTAKDRAYADKHLLILSGLYGVLRALDEIQPYRLEMGYKLPGNAHDASQPAITSMYTFWGDIIARQLPAHQDIINLSAKEYTKAVFPHFKNIEGLKNVTIISPKFLTISSKTGEPTFVTVHAKIARGAFARWLIQNRIEDFSKLREFTDLGYIYSESLSTPEEPVFVAKEFKGLGLSVRLT